MEQIASKKKRRIDMEKRPINKKETQQKRRKRPKNMEQIASKKTRAFAIYQYV